MPGMRLIAVHTSAALVVVFGIFLGIGCRTAFSDEKSDRLAAQIDEIKGRIKEPPPEGEMLLYREIDRTDSYISMLTQIIANAQTIKAYISKAGASRADVQSATKGLEGLACDTDNSKIRDAFNKILDTISETYRFVEQNGWKAEFDASVSPWRLCMTKETAWGVAAI